MSDDLKDVFERELLDDILGRSKGVINKKNTFFRDLCKQKINYKQSSEEIVQHEKFINIVDELNNKFPFFKITEFVEDFINGMYNKDMIAKYNFFKKSDFETCLRKNYLDLQQKREKILYPSDNSGFARRKNLKLTKNSQVYEFIIYESNYFENELNYLSNYNMARAIILLKFLNGKVILKKILKNEIIYDQNNVEYFQINLSNDIENIIKEKFDDIKLELYQKNILKFKDNDYKMEYNFNDIENSIKEIINNEIDGITYGNLVSKLIEKYPLVHLIPNYTIMTRILEKYEDLGIIKVESGFGNVGVIENRYISISNYSLDKFSEKIRQGIPKFFGRTNDPFQFIDDIKFLKKGDFSDEDDQVTRIAGLILVGTQTMISEPEHFSEFDFAVNMTGFSPTPEQLKIIEQSKIFVDPNCKLVHVKVMINDEVTLETIHSIKKILPKNEQAMIISFEKISNEVKNMILNDFSIQIIGKKELQLWAEITPEIPSRKGSITKIMAGKNVGNIARLNHVNYETGKATIELIPLLNEEVEYIGFLKEINLFEDSITDDHFTMSQNYFEFLKIVGKYSEINMFKKSIFNVEENSKILFVDRDRWELKENEIFGAKYNQFTCKIDLKKINFEKIFNCSCDYFQANSLFCIHLITILHELGIRNNYFSESWGNEKVNPLFACLKKI